MMRCLYLVTVFCLGAVITHGQQATETTTGLTLKKNPDPAERVRQARSSRVRHSGQSSLYRRRQFLIRSSFST